MRETQWKAFSEFRDAFKKKIADWQTAYPKVEFVYNTDLDKITDDNLIKFILVVDNPGKKEKELSRYLVGPAGQACRKFFKIELDYDDVEFSHSVIVLNKTPIYTAKTTDLNKIPKAIVEATQTWMAEQIAKLNQTLKSELWIIGKSELGKGGLFASFFTILQTNCIGKEGSYIKVFKHFSHNGFTNDYNLVKFTIQSFALSCHIRKNYTVIQPKSFLNKIGFYHKDLANGINPFAELTEFTDQLTDYFKNNSGIVITKGGYPMK